MKILGAVPQRHRRTVAIAALVAAPAMVLDVIGYGLTHAVHYDGSVAHRFQRHRREADRCGGDLHTRLRHGRALLVPDQEDLGPFEVNDIELVGIQGSPVFQLQDVGTRRQAVWARAVWRQARRPARPARRAHARLTEDAFIVRSSCARVASAPGRPPSSSRSACASASSAAPSTRRRALRQAPHQSRCAKSTPYALINSETSPPTRVSRMPSQTVLLRPCARSAAGSGRWRWAGYLTVGDESTARISDRRIVRSADPALDSVHWSASYVTSRGQGAVDAW